MTTHHLMTSVKNEAAYLLEWIAHHKSIGFEKIFIAANNCNDGTISLLRKLHENGFIEFAKSTPTANDLPQHLGYKTLRNRFEVNDCEWLMTLDVDEFLFVNIGDGTVSALTLFAPNDVDIIALNGLTFGSGPAPIDQTSVTERFKLRLPEKHTANCSVKTLTRNPKCYRGAHNHHLVGRSPAVPLTIMKADGTTFSIEADVKLWEILRRFHIDETCHDLAHYNHYSIRSNSEYRIRQERGRGAVSRKDKTKIRHTQKYFLERANSTIFDDRISKYDTKKDAEMQKMLDIGSIRRSHNNAVKKFLQKISEIETGEQ